MVIIISRGAETRLAGACQLFDLPADTQLNTLLIKAAL